MTTETALVTRVRHRITPEKWTVELGFSDPATVAAPISTSGPAGGAVPAGSIAATDPGLQAGNVVVQTNGAGRVTIGFPRPYQAAPVVVVTGGNGESLTLDPATSTTGFTVTAYGQTGQPIANNNIRVFWIANRATT